MAESSKVRLIREFIVIVVGVLAALSLESAYQRWQDVSAEAQYLMALEREALDNEDRVDRYVYVTDSVKAEFEAAVARVGTSVEDTSAAAIIRALRGAARQSGFPNVTSAVFQDLQSTGNFRLIRDVDQRQQVIDGYSIGEAARERLRLSTERIDSRLLALLGESGVPITSDVGMDASRSLVLLKAHPGFEAELGRERARLELVLFYLNQSRQAFEDLASSLAAR